jgi:2-polyprenyl-3-methyl-5-hydroxy-6-metoxy-1,4-benzoquinol methylase
MIKIGKPISKTLLARTFVWKRQVHSQNRIHAARMLEEANHDEIVRCLVCDNLTFPYTEVDKVAYGHCKYCNHVQSSIRPSASFLETLYGSEEPDYSSQDLAYVNLSQLALDSRVDDIAAPKVEWIQSLINFDPQDLWLDIGSGTGETLLAARKAGFSVLGIEISPSEISLAQSRSVPTIPMFFDGSQKIAELKTAKVISVLNILEHTLDPLYFLSGISQQMSSGSYLVIEVPRLNGFSSIIQCAHPNTVYRHIFSPEHLNIFSDESIDFCLDKLSMERQATWYFGSDAIEIFGYVIELTQPHFDKGLDGYSNEINLLQQQIDNNGLSDVMLLVTKKK